MTAPLYPKHAFNVVPGEPQPTVADLVTQFFRRAIAAVLRERSAPEVKTLASGAAPALPAGAEPVLGIGNGTIAEARARQDAWTAEDVAVTGHPATAPAGFPALTPAQQGAVPGGGPLPRRIPGASVREHGSWT
jgi:hypothetical protein